MQRNAWWKSWLAWLGIGVVLFVWAGLALTSATRAQLAEQQRRDTHWQQVNADAARSRPPMLPGEEKPAPAPLEGRWMIALLAIAATGAVARAGWLWLERLPGLGSGPRAEPPVTPPDQALRETGPSQRGTLSPPSLSGPPPSRSSSSSSPPFGTPPGIPPVAPPALRGEPPFQPLETPLPPPQAAPRPRRPGTPPGNLPEGDQWG